MRLWPWRRPAAEKRSATLRIAVEGCHRGGDGHRRRRGQRHRGGAGCCRRLGPRARTRDRHPGDFDHGGTHPGGAVRHRSRSAAGRQRGIRNGGRQRAPAVVSGLRLRRDGRRRSGRVAVPADAAGADFTDTVRRLPAESVLHFRINDDGRHYGQSPIACAGLSSALLANIERGLARESKAPSGYVIPSAASEGMDDADFEELREDLGKLKGGTRLVPSQGPRAGDPQSRPADQDWKPRRLGIDPPESLVDLRSGAAIAVFGAAGVPPTMFTDASDRNNEALRLFIHRHPAAGGRAHPRGAARQARGRGGVELVEAGRGGHAG